MLGEWKKSYTFAADNRPIAFSRSLKKWTGFNFLSIMDKLPDNFYYLIIFNINTSIGASIKDLIVVNLVDILRAFEMDTPGTQQSIFTRISPFPVTVGEDRDRFVGPQ